MGLLAKSNIGYAWASIGLTIGPFDGLNLEELALGMEFVFFGSVFTN